MSTRTNLPPQVVIAAGDMSAATITSTPTILRSLTEVSYQVTWSGSTPVGTLALQVSNTYALAPDGTTAVAGTWTTVPLQLDTVEVTSVPISGNTGNGVIDAIIGSYAIRLLYTKASGTGTLTAVINGKVS